MTQLLEINKKADHIKIITITIVIQIIFIKGIILKFEESLKFLKNLKKKNYLIIYLFKIINF